MKKLILLPAILLSVCLIAQEDLEEVKLWTIYPGYVITHDNDTIHGFIKLNNLVDNQKKALFYNSPDDEKYAEKYKAKDIKAYMVGPRYYESFKFWPETEARGVHFFLKVLDGPISLYEWYYEPQSRTDERVKIDEDNVMNSKIDLSFSEADLDTQLIGIKLGGEPEQLDKLKYVTNFKKNMSKYLEDYPELAEKIANKMEGYQFINLEEIIKEYNAWYLAKH
jgi:hypothetical protein